MKRLLIVTIINLLYLSAQAQTNKTDNRTFGKTFTVNNPVAFSVVPEQMRGKDSMYVQASGIIKEVCQAKGCWMKVNAGQGNEMMIKFKDYAFFVPKDIVGKQVVLNGVVYQKTLTVAQLRHYAEDAGKSEKEIARIKQPQTSLQFEADGVLIKEN
jgi:hypothetical protein